LNPKRPDIIQFGREICGDLAQAERREWWLTNGLGGYAAGTIAQSLTRRYHGLLIAPLRPPLGRVLVAAKADATLIDGDREWPLFSNRWRSAAVEPQGNVFIESFLLDGRMPVWRFAVEDIRLEERIWMEPGANTTYVAYRLEPDRLGQVKKLWLRVKVLINRRDDHGQTLPGDFSPALAILNGQLCVAYSNGFSLYVSPQGGVIESLNYWVENFDLAIERERGLPDWDNHLCAGEARLELIPGQWAGLIFSIHQEVSPDLQIALERFRKHDAGVIELAEKRIPEMASAPDWIRQLLLAADSFPIARPLPSFPDGESVIAGYPWFGDWGRDTMVALSGLTLATGRFETARRILETFANFIDRGMLPNVFPGSGESPEYNTVDAALWYIEAWRAYVEATKDHDSLRKIFPILQGILEQYQKGTRFSIHMDPDDGLLFAGEAGVQLTWMDAKVGDWVVTPRIGKPVEINALWFNAHRVMAAFARRLGFPFASYAELADKIRESFAKFMDHESGGLFDVIDGPEGNDNTVRPNQILAVSLTYSPIPLETQKRVVALCKRCLLCSLGLRSLAPSHKDYRPHYRGAVWERDGAYHQGTVWPWLLGHYALAEFRVHGDPAFAQGLLEAVRHHLFDAGLGTISETFEGDPPHVPRGCPSQAWSVACILDSWLKLEQAKRKKTEK
jgi:4-alpha-glucanotransferase